MVTMAKDCPVTGQMRSDCASACGFTCNNYRDASCTDNCVINGCQCPVGTVINEETNSCVAMENCPKGKLSSQYHDNGSHDLILAGLTCPNVTSPGICNIDCNDDGECDGNSLCCYNGCGHFCTVAVECAVSIAS